MATTAILKVTFTGRNGSGSISAPELLAGDLLIATYHPADPNGLKLGDGVFKGIVLTDGEIEQIFSNDLSAETYVCLFVRMT